MTKEIAKRDDIIKNVVMRVQQMQQLGQISFPPDYAPLNALQAARSLFEEKPELMRCSKASIATALLKTVSFGLDPQLDQIYYIPRGDKLCGDIGYKGWERIATRSDRRVVAINAKPIYEGDDYQHEIRDGMDFITGHKPGPNYHDDSKIIHAYAIAPDKDGNHLYGDFMTIAEVKKAWQQGGIKPVNKDGSIKESSTHGKFSAKMVEKTVISRLGKKIGRAGSSGAPGGSFEKLEMQFSERDADDTIAAEAMSDPINIEVEEAPDREPVKFGVEDFTCPYCGNVAPEAYCGECKKEIPA